MLILHGINMIKNFKTKKSRRERLNSALYKKDIKNYLKGIENQSYINSQPNMNNNNMFEETKCNSNLNNYKNSLIIPEKGKNFLSKNSNFPIKINNSNEISLQMESKNNKPKNKCIFLTYKDNHNINNKKKNIYKPINVNRFISEVNSFLLPNDQTFENLKNLINYRIIHKESSKNPEFYQLLKRNELSNKIITFELFYKYIIKKTFKELLKKGYSKNTLIDKKEIKEEYQKHLNEIKQYLKLENEEKKDKVNNKYLELFRKNSYYTCNSTCLNENKNYKIINIEKNRKISKINQNNSVDNLSFHFYNFDKASNDLRNQNMRFKYQEITKRKFKILLSLSNTSKLIEKNIMKNTYINKFQSYEEKPPNSEQQTKENKPIKETKKEVIENYQNKNEIFKTSVVHPKIKKLNDLIKTKKKINNNKPKNNNNKGDFQTKTENSSFDKISGFNFFLDKHNSISNKNEDIISFLYNNENMIKFSNILINNNINKYSLNTNKKLDLNLEKENTNKKKETEVNNATENSNMTSELFNNSLNLENEYKGKDLSLQAQPKFKSSFLNNTSSQKSLIEEKFVIDKSFFNDNNNLKLKKKSLMQNYSQLFFKDTKSTKEIEKESEFEKKYKILLNKKIFVKKKKKAKDRSFKEFMKEEQYDEKLEEKKIGENKDKKVKIIENKIEEKKIGENNNEKEKNISEIKKDKKEEKEKIREKKFDSKFNDFKKYIQKLKNMTKDEFVDDTLKFIKY